MSKLSNLLENVDHFYNTAVNEYRLSKLAAEPPQTWSMPDDPDDEGDGPPTDRAGGQNDLFTQVQEAARSVRDPDAVSEALLVANLYRKAVQLDDGFNFVVQKIKAALNSIEVDDPDDEEDPTNLLVESLMAMSVDAAKRAKQVGGGMNKGDSDAGTKALRNLQQTMNTDERERDLARSGKSVSDLADYDESAKGVFDMSGGVGMEEAQKSGRGYFVRNRKDPKDWIKTYENEKQMLMEELPHDTDRNIVRKKQQLVEILEKLKRATAVEASTAEKIQTTTGWTERDDGEGGKVQVAVNPQDQTEIESARSELKELKNQRSTLRASLRQDVLGRQQDKLLDEHRGAKDKKSKDIFYQKLLLLKNLRSQDKNKGAETKARRLLISYLENGGTTESEVGRATVTKLLENIKRSEDQKIPIAEWNKQEAARIKDIKQMGDRRLSFTDVGDFPSQLRRLKQHVPNVKMGDKKEVIDKWREQVIISANEQEKTTFAPQLGALAAAKQSGSREQLKAAMSALYTALMNAVEQFQTHATRIAQRMERIERDYTDVTSFRKKLEILDKEGLINKGDLDSAQMKRLHEQLKSLAPEAYALSQRSYANPFSGRERDSTKKLLEGMYLVLNSHLQRTRHAESMERKEQRAALPPAEKVALEPLGEVENDLTGEIMYKFRDPSSGEISYRGSDGALIPDEDLSDEFKHKKASRGYMNRKQRKIACKQLEKVAFVDTSVPAEINSLLNDPSLNSIEDSNEYAHQVFQKMLASINEKMKKMY